MSTLLKLVQSHFAVSILAGVLGALSVLGIRSTSILEPLELTVYDWLIQSRRGSEGADPRIVLITVTEQDILSQGRWPITDAILAEARRIFDRIRKTGDPAGSDGGSSPGRGIPAGGVVLLVALVLALAGLGVSIYLTIAHFTESALAMK